ncbi:hypothetical protein LMP26_14215, partial [Staphylococcus aureus]|nr:hypothetical protein [Staphylococcus aureus]
MKIKELLHKIPETWIIMFILSMLFILLVYFVSTIHSLKRQLENMGESAKINNEAFMQRARSERLEDMTQFFNTNE